MDFQTICLLACGFVLVSNAFCFALMGYDKRQAIRGEWRVPERKLFLCAACFGALGGVIGMRLFRHKTRHLHFVLLFPFMLVAQVLLLGWMACRILPLR